MSTRNYPHQALVLFKSLFLVCCLISTFSALAQSATTTSLEITVKGISVTSTSSAPVTFTAKVLSGTTGVTVGAVNFCDAAAPICSDIHLLGTAHLGTGGTATLTVAPLLGAHTYKAEFLGTTSYIHSTSQTIDLTFLATTTTTITPTGTTGNYTVKATITGKGLTTAPTGTVEVIDTSTGDTVLASKALVDGAPGANVWSNPQSPAVQNLPESIAVGDFNGDGIPDLVVGHSGISGSSTPGYLSILLGNANGTFQTAKTFPLGIAATSIAVGHFVTGGPLDVIIIDSGPTSSTGTTSSNNAQVFVGDGTGGGAVKAPFTLNGIGSATSVAVSDLNRDGKDDIVVSGIIYGIYGFAPLLGNGNGTFGQPTINAVSDYPVYDAIGSFGPNGYPDIVVVDSNAGQVTIFQNNGQGFFFPEGQANTGVTPIAMVTGDFNGDGHTDVAVLNNGSKDVTIMLGNGNYALVAQPFMPIAGNNPTAIATGDFNHDGILDLAVANANDDTVTIFIGNGDGTFTPITPAPKTGKTPVSLAVGNFNGTGEDSIAVANEDQGATTGSTLTILASTLEQTATATATSIKPIGTGAHLVDGSYLGNSDYASSISTTSSLNGVILPIPTLTINCTPSPVVYGQQLTCSSTVSGDYKGTISFSINGTLWTSGAPNSSGIFSASTAANLTLGSNTFAANYSGDSNYAPASASVNVTVNKSTQTITFTAPPDPVRYGVAPISLLASASSGLPVTFSVTGPAMLSGTELTILGVGTVEIKANQAGSGNYAAAAAVSHVIVVDKADLTVHATSATVAYNQPIPTLTYTITGFVNGDTATVVSGAPVESTTATKGSAAGKYTITITKGTLSAANYGGWATANGTLTISAASGVSAPVSGSGQ